ncbi:Ig-like domain-containing protein [Hymenobacter sp. B81]|uniref:Ig-like domain-containing protein n=1 Tax=Hymenobacter sp. B81 TaxID=3344878 RepID=UPI0037DD55F2
MVTLLRFRAQRPAGGPSGVSPAYEHLTAPRGRRAGPGWLLRTLLLLATALGSLAPAQAQRGKDGARSVSAVGVIVNEYTTLTANAAAGTRTLNVANGLLNANARFSGNLAAGDLVMIIQMQGATISTADDATYGNVTAYNSAGRYELVEVASATGTTITLTCGLTNSYSSAGRTQVVRVPRYTTLTITGAGNSITGEAWNGSQGGVIAIDATGEVLLGTGTTINASGLGFRGGAAENDSDASGNANFGYRSTSSAYGAEKGEGIAGSAADYTTGRFGRGAPANGGGGGNSHNAGGGGGSNVGTGTWTGTGVPNRGTSNAFDAAWNLEGANFATSSSPGGGRGGYSYSSAEQNALTTGPGNTGWGGDNRQSKGGFGGRPLDRTGRLFLGGGGGAGDGNNSGATSGGRGGGIVYILGGGTVRGVNATSSQILASGVGTTNSNGQDAPGGGGGGGTIVLNASGTISSLTVQAQGGTGGSQAANGAEAEGPGGGGGGGYLAYTNAGTALTLSVAGGANGTTSSTSLTEFPPNGATRGNSGLTDVISFGLQCAATVDLVSTISGPATANAGSTITYTVTTTNNGPNPASGVAQTVQLPTGLTFVTLPTNATYNSGTGVLTLEPVSTLNSGASVVTSFQFTAPTTTPISGVVSSTTTSNESNAANNNGTAPAATVTTVINRAPVAANVTTTALPGSNGATQIANFNVTDPDGNATIATYTFVSVPTAAQGLLYAYNATSTAFVQITTAGQTVNAATYPNLVFDPSGTSSGNVAFQYSATDNGGLSSNTATYTIPVNNVAPTAANLTAPILLSSYGPTLLTPALAGADTDGTITGFTITSIPNTTTQGVLALNGNAVTVGQPINPAQAAQLTFDPVVGFFGNATFGYTATDNSGAVSAAATYAIPVSKATCGQENLVNFATRSTGENWATGQSVTVQGVTITSSGYTAPAGTSLVVDDQAALPGKGLVWSTDYGTGTTKTATVTLTFSRPLTNFSLNVGDIDLGTGYIDELTVDGYNASNALITLAAADVALGSNSTNVYSGSNRITGSASNTSAAGNVIVTFPQAVSRLVLTYRNTTAVTDPAFQFLDITSLAWCAEANLATTISGPTRALAGSTVTYTATTTNAGPDAADNVVATIQLATGLTVPASPNYTYSSSTGLVTFTAVNGLASGATLTNQVSFTMPATNTTGRAASTTLAIDAVLANNNGSAANANITTVVDQAPVAANVTTSPAIPSSAAATAILPLSATDPDDAASTLTYTLVTLPTGGTLAVNGTPATLGQTLTATQITQLTFDPTGTSNGSFTFTYRAQDPLGAVSNVATYTIPVSNTPPVAANVTNTPVIPSSAGATAILPLSATDADGSISSYTILSLPAGGTLFVNGAQATVGQPLNATQITQLTFDPAGTSNGNFTFTYTAVDNQGASGNTATYTIPVGNVAPVALNVTNATLSDAAPATTLSALNATDADGSISSYTITNVPNATTQGVLALNGNPVTNGQVVLAAQAGQLTFDPVAGAGGDYRFTFTATDNNGAVSANTAAFTIPVRAAGPAGCGTPYAGGAPTSGLYSQYYAGYYADNLSYFNTRTPGLVRNDAQLNFASNNTNTVTGWGSIIPPATAAATDATNPEQYTARIRGSVYLPVSGQYTFYLTSDDATYLWLDGAALATTPVATNATINASGAHAVRTDQVTVELSAGLHNLMIFYGEQAGENRLVLEYSNTAAGIARQVIPNTAFCAGATNVPPLASNVTTAPVANTNGPTLIAALAGTDQDGTVDGFIVATLPAASAGVLSLNGVNVVAGQQLTAAQAAQLRFDPVLGFSGSATFTFYAVDNTPQRSNTAATYTIPVGTAPVAVNDVLTTPLNTALTFNPTQNDTGSFVAGSVDLDPNQAGQQTSRTLTGQGTFVVNTSTGAVTFTPVTGFVGTASLPYQISSATGVVSNQANIAVTVQAPTTDVATSITAPAGGSTVVAGSPVTFTVVATNNSATAAADVVQTLQLPAGLTGLSFSNGGSYNPTTGLVTFPTIASLAGNGSATFGVTFNAPASGPFTGAANIRTATNESDATNNAASVLVNVSNSYDLATAINGPTTTVAGQLVTFGVVTSNNGPSSVSSVVQTVQLPIGLTNVYVTNNGTYTSNNGRVTFPNVTLAAGQSVNNSVSFTAPATGFTATASVTPTAADTNLGNNTASAPATTVSPMPTQQANLFVALAASQANPAPGQQYSYTVTFGNDGPAAATNVTARVFLPPGLTVTGLPSGSSYNPATGEITSTAPLPSLPSGSSQAYTFQVVAPEYGSVVASASIAAATADPMPGNNVATTTVTVTPQADVATTISGPTTAVAGQLVTYTVTTTNNGEASATGVVQTVSLPANLAVAPTLSSGTYSATSGLVTFGNITLLSGASRTYTVTYVAPPASSFVTTAAVRSTSVDDVASNNAASVVTTTSRTSDVVVTLAGPSTVVNGNTAVYTVTTVNNGPSPAASVTTQVQLATGLADVVVSDGGSYNPATGLVTFPARTDVAVGIPGAQTSTISLTAPNATSLNATATAVTSAATNDQQLANNTATLTTTVNQPTTNVSDLAVAITSNFATRPTAQVISYTVTLTNNGPTTAGNVTSQVALRPGLVDFAPGTSGATYDAVTGIVTLPTTTSLAAASGSNTVSFTFMVDAPAEGPLVATASVSSDNSDNVPANNVAQRTVTISPRANAATRINGPASALPGAPVTYSVVTLNSGISAAADVVQTVQLPTGLTGVTVSGGGSYDPGTGLVTFPTIASLAPGTASQLTNTITFTFGTSSITPVASVTTTTTETSTSNSASVTTSVANLAPQALAVTNSVTAPDGNTAVEAQALSPLTGRDADGTITAYTIATLPPATRGVLYLNGVAVVDDQELTPAEAAQLSFVPAAGFVGNAFFTFTVTDNSGATSGTAFYTIPVGLDNASTYTNAPVRGGTNNAYQNGDLISSVFDVNGGAYNASAQVTDNGVRSAVLAAGSNPLPPGTSLNPVTGAITVTNRQLLVAGTYTVNITTTDEFGGTTTQPLTVSIGLLPLPVELVTFEARAKGVDALLTWETASEKNNARFEVERSTDGRSFVKVGEVAGNGTTAARQRYSFVDANAAAVAATVYYRLKQVDFDGTSSTSQPRTVSFEGTTAQAELRLFPSPATDVLNVQVLAPAQQATVTVYATTGALLLTQELGSSLRTVLDVSQLPTGAYVLKVQTANGLHFTRRFVKQ